MSIHPEALKDSMSFYRTLMHGASPLSRSHREMLAVVVSSINHCVYWIRAHAHDLRAEVEDDFGIEDGEDADLFVQQLASNWKQASLTSSQRALCIFAEKLTRANDSIRYQDLEKLRKEGYDDRSIHDVVQIIGYFNYINRVADGLGVEPESFVKKWEIHE